MMRLLSLCLLGVALASCDSADDTSDGFDVAAIVGTYQGVTESLVGEDYFAPPDTVRQAIEVTISEVRSATTPLRMTLTCTSPEGSETPGVAYLCGELVGRADAGGAFFYRSYDPDAEANGLRVGRAGQVSARRSGTAGDGVSFTAETTGELSARRFDLTTTTTYRQGDRTGTRRETIRTVKVEIE